MNFHDFSFIFLHFWTFLMKIVLFDSIILVLTSSTSSRTRNVCKMKNLRFLKILGQIPFKFSPRIQYNLISWFFNLKLDSVDMKFKKITISTPRYNLYPITESFGHFGRFCRFSGFWEFVWIFYWLSQWFIPAVILWLTAVDSYHVV